MSINEHPKNTDYSTSFTVTILAYSIDFSPLFYSLSSVLWSFLFCVCFFFLSVFLPFRSRPIHPSGAPSRNRCGLGKEWAFLLFLRGQRHRGVIDSSAGPQRLLMQECDAAQNQTTQKSNSFILTVGFKNSVKEPTNALSPVGNLNTIIHIKYIKKYSLLAMFSQLSGQQTAFRLHVYFIRRFEYLHLNLWGSLCFVLPWKQKLCIWWIPLLTSALTLHN